jgi:cytochrome d ubiquinol oxidase subunit I
MLLWVLSAMTFSGWVAVLAGWYVTEIGRQPWIVYDLIRSSEVVAEHGGGTVLSTLIAYCLLYLFLLVSYIAALNYLSGKPIQSIGKEVNYGKGGTATVADIPREAN